MCTHNQCFRAKIRKNIIFFLLKNNIFTAVKYCCILHGRVCVMILRFFIAVKMTKKKKKKKKKTPPGRVGRVFLNYNDMFVLSWPQKI